MPPTPQRTLTEKLQESVQYSEYGWMKSSYSAAQTHCVWVYERDMLSTEGLLTDQLPFAPYNEN